MTRLWVAALVLLLGAEQAAAASREVLYAPPPAWALPAPTPTEAAPQRGAPVHLVYQDMQARLSEQGEEAYGAYRMKILTSQGLEAGAIQVSWRGDTDTFTVHGLKVHRGEEVIDVLKTTRFEVIQRERNLERSMLDGVMTAALQAPGLRIGDEIEFSATILRTDPVMKGRAAGGLQLPPMASSGAHRVRLLWPQSHRLRWKATPDLGALEPTRQGGDQNLIVELRNPRSVIMTDNAPRRVNLRRMIEYSSFSDWSEVAGLLEPLYQAAAALGPNSAVKREAAKIAAETSDPLQRAEAALRLVQQNVRYVFIGMDGGNYRPESAELTWERRFGDCKAKTALLLALLQELGVRAEAVAVDLEGGDGSDARLPSLGAFNHVLVRADIAGKRYWLDGVREGDANLAMVPPPPFRWALALKAGASLEAVPAIADDLPQLTDKLAVDASKGYDAPAAVTAQQTVRGDAAFKWQTDLAALTAEDSERAQKDYWKQEHEWVEAETVSWRYDEAQKVLVLTMTGTGKPDWEGDAQNGRSLDIWAAGFSPPSEKKRPAEQDQTAPWATSFPTHVCYVTLIRLPPVDTAKWRWTYRAAPVNRRLGGVRYWRQAALDGDVMRTSMSSQAYLPEITAEQAREVNAALPTFDRYVSQVYQRPANLLSTAAAGRAVAETGDWREKTLPCAPPQEGAA